MRLLALLTLSMWSSVSLANESGRFTFLGENQCAPFEGVLFDPAATAQMLTQIQSAPAACDVRLKYELGKQAADYELQLQNLTIRYDSLTQEYKTSIESLQRENAALGEALRKQSPKNPALWVVVGVASGIALSYGAYRVLDER